MSNQLRGGFPVIENHTVTAAGGKFPFRAVANWVQVSSDGSLEIFTEEQKFIDGTDNIPLPASGGIWEGPADIEDIWMKTPVGTTDVVLVYFTRKG